MSAVWKDTVVWCFYLGRDGLGVYQKSHETNGLVEQVDLFADEPKCSNSRALFGGWAGVWCIS